MGEGISKEQQNLSNEIRNLIVYRDNSISQLLTNLNLYVCDYYSYIITTEVEKV